MYQTEDNTEKGCILLLLCFISLGAFLYFSYSTYMYCGFSPDMNPTTKGIIEKSLIEKTQFERRGYSINVTYKYEVDGKKYRSNMICCGSTANELSRDIIKKYPVGSEVTVYYRQKNPRLSVLETKISRSQAITIAAFGLLVLVTILMSLYYAKKD